jgi:acetyltransferase
MMEQTRIYAALKGVRGRKPVDLAGLEEVMVRFSQLVVEQRWIKEIDINPLVASPDKIVALDARVVLHEPGVREEDLPKLAIRPYPARYVAPWTMNDGTPVLIRPIRPEDEPLMVKFHETISERSVYHRYLEALQFTERVAHERLTRICFIDYDREIALVAELDPPGGEKRIIGISRLKKAQGTTEGDVAALVSDEFQGRGLGTELTRRIIEVASDEGLSRVCGDLLPDNYFARIAEHLGFRLRRAAADGVAKAELDLRVVA